MPPLRSSVVQGDALCVLPAGEESDIMPYDYEETFCFVFYTDGTFEYAMSGIYDNDDVYYPFITGTYEGTPAFDITFTATATKIGNGIFCAIKDKK